MEAVPELNPLFRPDFVTLIREVDLKVKNGIYFEPTIKCSSWVPGFLGCRMCISNVWNQPTGRNGWHLDFFFGGGGAGGKRFGFLTANGFKQIGTDFETLLDTLKLVLNVYFVVLFRVSF